MLVDKDRVMIIRLIGGLGNQLFQLQYGFSLKSKYGGQLRIDDSFLLQSKKMHEKIAVTPLITSLPMVRLNWFQLKIKRTIERFFYKSGFTTPLAFNPVYLFEESKINLEDMSPIILDGFWQGVRYLDMTFIKKLRFNLAYFQSFPPPACSVCVHVRRGDYLTSKLFFKSQQVVLPLLYYVAAFEYYRSILPLPNFYIYTDDEPWATETFKSFSNVVVVSTSSMDSFQLLANMSNYEHFIIANSTLSWWAAVASRKGRPTVVMPKIWGVNIESVHFRCDNWTII